MDVMMSERALSNQIVAYFLLSYQLEALYICVCRMTIRKTGVLKKMNFEIQNGRSPILKICYHLHKHLTVLEPIIFH